MTTPRPALGVAMVLASAGLFAVNGTVSKLVLRAGLDVPQLTLLRAVGAVTGLLLLSVLLRPGIRRLRVTPGQLPLLIGYGLAGFFAVPMLYFVAISRLPVGIGLLFEYTAPLLVALWARFAQRHRVRPRLWAGLALSLVGLGCVAEVWGELKLDGLGVLAGFGAALFLAVYYVLGAHGAARRDTLSLCTWAFGASAVAGLLTRALTVGAGGWEPLGADTDGGVPVALLCGYAVVLGSIAPYLLVAGAMRHLPATSVGILGMAEPVLAAAVAWAVIGPGEALNTAQLTGGLLVLAGVALAETARIAPPRTIAPPVPAPPEQPAPAEPVSPEPSAPEQPEPSAPAGPPAPGGAAPPPRADRASTRRARSGRGTAG
ncbi:DMT family transporter [Micromonospora sp. NPDC049048]|uniref:EamA family transporter n=1 Tax=Micromonospora sp. NPDC049048 TaxID=3364263 RepID=UPI003714E09B